MWGTVLVCCALVGAGPEGDRAPASAVDDPSAYERARKEAGRDAGAHVRLALWCEAHGMSAERMRHLALAVLYEPSHPLARGLMGMVAHGGRWGRPEEIGRKIQEDPSYRERVEEYLKRRAETPDRPDAQMKLAAWCEQNGLKAQAIAHYNLVVRLDPTRESAWKRLGYKKSGGRWVRPEEAAAQKLEAERQKHADKDWKPRLARMREDLDSKSNVRRARAAGSIAGVTEPRAVPMIWSVFVARGTERSQLAAVQMFGQIDGTAASLALATLAILDPQGTVRARAAETLMRRDPREIADRLIAMVRKPFSYQVRPVGLPGSSGELFVEGETFNVRRVYRTRSIDPGLIPAQSFAMAVMADPTADPASPPPAVGGRNSAAALTFDPLGAVVSQALASATTTQAQRAAQRLDAVRRDTQAQRERLAEDVQALDATNAQIKELNGRVLPILSAMTGQDLGAEPEKWKAWWTDRLGYYFQKSSTETKPTFTEVIDAPSPSWSASLECFGAGTPVATIDGPRPIEAIRVGDRVLAQDTSTGVLGFQPVLAIHKTKSAATVRVTLADGEAMDATGIHRFWKAGQGWVCARDLKPGDRVRGLGSISEVKSVEASASRPVYNLDVAERHDFFVGKAGLLVHDSGFVRPVASPFDREPVLATATKRNP